MRIGSFLQNTPYPPAPMKLLRLFLASLALIISAQAQFTLDLRPIAPGAGELRFTLNPGYYYCLESSGDLTGTFAPASGWMLGNGLLKTWTLNYPTNPAAGGGGTGATGGEVFSLFPFTNGKTLVTWFGPAEARFSVLMAADYAGLPPFVNVPGSGSAPYVLLLSGRIDWDSAYETLVPTLLPAAQQTALTHLPTPAAAMQAATAGGTASPGMVIDSAKHFFRIHRMETDADGDGLDWATEVFLLGTDPDDADSDHDGISDGDEIANGTSPGNDDSDKDGVKDGSDRYPNDERRSEDIPVKFYGVIDLSQYQYADQTPVKPLAQPQMMRIDDQNRVAWLSVETVDIGTGEDDTDGTKTSWINTGPRVTATTWQDGVAAQAAVVTDVHNTGRTTTHHTDSTHWTGWSDERYFSIARLRATGELFGEASHLTNSYERWIPGARSGTSSYVLRGHPGDTPVPLAYLMAQTPALTHRDDNTPFYDSPFQVALGILDEGNLGTVGVFSYVSGDPDNYNSWQQHRKVFRGTPDGPYVPDGFDGEGAAIASLSDAGPMALTYHALLSFDSIDPAKVWRGTDGLADLGLAAPYAINAQDRTVGSLYGWVGGAQVGYEDPEQPRPGGTDPRIKGRGELGFLWTPDGGVQTFQDLLPEKFRKQMRSAVPFLITNKDTATNTYQITFTAESWEGVDSAADWVWGYFIFEQKGTEEPTVRGMLLPSIYDSALGKYRPMNVNLAAVNVNGIHAGIVERTTQATSSAQSSAAPAAPPPPPEPTTGPGVIAAIEFQARLPFSEGFDPPMRGDVDPLTNEKDFDPQHPENWVAWTSVAKSGSLSVNERTKVVFPNAELASMCEVVAEGGTTSPITVSTPGGMAVETNLHIEGQAGDNNIKEAVILVRMKDAPSNVLCRMKVMVLPMRPPIDTRFYVVRNSLSSGDTFWHQPWTPGQTEAGPASSYVLGTEGVYSPSQIVEEINARMKPCAVVCVLGSASCPDRIVNFDRDPRNYTFDEVERKYLNGADFAGQCVFLYLPTVNDSQGNSVKGGYFPTTKFIALNFRSFVGPPIYAIDDALGGNNSMQRVAAHEFGHFLQMSVRRISDGHDPGPFPKGTKGLMLAGQLAYPTTKGQWTRHEDWKVANLWAQLLQP